MVDKYSLIWSLYNQLHTFVGKLARTGMKWKETNLPIPNTYQSNIIINLVDKVVRPRSEQVISLLKTVVSLRNNGHFPFGSALMFVVSVKIPRVLLLVTTISAYVTIVSRKADNYAVRITKNLSCSFTVTVKNTALYFQLSGKYILYLLSNIS